MFDSESEGSAKGSLKDRLRFLTILMRISRKNKLKVRFAKINADKLKSINRFYLFFYNPVKLPLKNDSPLKNTILYNGINPTKRVLLTKDAKSMDVELEIVRKVRRKKGIGESENSSVKEEIKEKYNVQEENISQHLINDYLAIKNNSQELFDLEVSEETKEELILDRIKAEKYFSLIDKTGIEDYYLSSDIEYDIALGDKSLDKLTIQLEKQKAEIEKLSTEIDKFSVSIEQKLKVTNLFSLLNNTIGIGIGLLTLPFSFSRTIALGTNLIEKSVNNIHEKVKINVSKRKMKSYRITIKDIETSEKALKTSDFLLEETLEKLDHLKYKIKLYDYKIPDVSKKLKEIEAIESGLAKKKRELRKIVESFEKSKTKVLERNNSKAA